MPDSNELGKILLHKNRDFGKGRELPVVMKITEAEQGKYRCIDICEYMFFNEKGFAVMNNAMPKTADAAGNECRGNSKNMRRLAESCATVSEAIALIQTIQSECYIHSSNYLMTDGKETVMVEVTAKHFAVRKCEKGIMVHTNHFVSPELEPHLGGKKAPGKSVRRQRLTEEQMAEAVKKEGTLRMADNLRISRYHDDAGFPDQAPFRNSTVCAADYIVDADYPLVLNTIWVQPGPTCCTLALAVPLCCQKMPEALSSGELGRLSYQVKALGGPDHAHRAELSAAELQFWKEYQECLDSSRKLLKAGKGTEAAAQLQALLDRQSAQALALMKGVVEKLRKEHPQPAEAQAPAAAPAPQEEP